MKHFIAQELHMCEAELRKAGKINSADFPKKNGIALTRKAVENNMKGAEIIEGRFYLSKKKLKLSHCLKNNFWDSFQKSAKYLW